MVGVLGVVWSPRQKSLHQAPARCGWWMGMGDGGWGSWMAVMINRSRRWAVAVLYRRTAVTRRYGTVLRQEPGMRAQLGIARYRGLPYCHCAHISRIKETQRPSPAQQGHHPGYWSSLTAGTDRITQRPKLPLSWLSLSFSVTRMPSSVALCRDF